MAGDGQFQVAKGQTDTPQMEQGWVGVRVVRSGDLVASELQASSSGLASVPRTQLQPTFPLYCQSKPADLVQVWQPPKANMTYPPLLVLLVLLVLVLVLLPWLLRGE